MVHDEVLITNLLCLVYSNDYIANIRICSHLEMCHHEGDKPKQTTYYTTAHLWVNGEELLCQSSAISNRMDFVSTYQSLSRQSVQCAYLHGETT